MELFQVLLILWAISCHIFVSLVGKIRFIKLERHLYRMLQKITNFINSFSTFFEFPAFGYAKHVRFGIAALLYDTLLIFVLFRRRLLCRSLLLPLRRKSDDRGISAPTERTEGIRLCLFIRLFGIFHIRFLIRWEFIRLRRGSDHDRSLPWGPCDVFDRKKIACSCRPRF